MKSRCFEPAGHVSHSPSLPLHLLPCWFSPSAEQQGRFSRCNRGPRQKGRVFYSLLLCDPHGVARAETRSSLHRRHLKSRKCVRKTETFGARGCEKKSVPPPLSARTFLRLCFAALSVKGNMRERPGKLDKAAQKRNGCFLYEAFSLSSRS